MNFLRNLIQGSQSASRADSEQKKKGGVPPPGSADPPCKLEEEADAQRVTTEPVPENINGASPPSSPRSPPHNASPQSVIKDCETPSTTEEASFASCLTEEPSSLSENVPTSPVKASQPTNAVVKGLSGLIKNTDSSLNSDSEYESAEEVDLPQDPTPVVTQQPSSDKSLPVPPGTGQIHCLEQTESRCGDQQICEDKPRLESSIKENSITESSIKTETNCAEAQEATEGLVSAISESLVTVTKNEIIEESISKKTFVEQEVTEVISNHTLLNGEVNANVVELQEDLPFEKHGCDESETTDKADTNCNTGLSENSVSSASNEKDNLNKVHEEGKGSAHIQNSFNYVQNEVSNCEQISAVKEEKHNFDTLNDCESLKENHKEEPLQKKEFQETTCQPTHQEESKENPAKLVSTEKPSAGHSEPSFGNQDLKSVSSEQVSPEEQPIGNGIVDEDIPLSPPKKGYCLDFLDNLEDPNFNPFATKTAVRNTPPPSPEAGRKLPPLKPAVKKKKEPKSSIKDTNPTAEKDEVKTVLEKKVEETPVTECAVPGDTPKSDQLSEVTFEESKEPKKPPPRLNKKSVPNKKPVNKTPVKSKVVEKNNNRVDEKTLSETEPKSEPEDLPIPPSKGYNLDFLDSLEDPNFNPFATKTTVSNSPPKEGFTVSNDEEIKPKAKVVTPKKTAVKKGFTVIKNKAKAAPLKPEEDPKADKVESGEEKTASESKQRLEENSKPPEEEDLPLPPKKGYNLAFLDDPDFDPFKSGTNLDNKSSSPPGEDSKPSRQVLGGPCDDQPKKETETLQSASEAVKEKPEQGATLATEQDQDVSIPRVEEKVDCASAADQTASIGSDTVDSVGRNEVVNSSIEEKRVEVTSVEGDKSDSLDIQEKAVEKEEPQLETGRKGDFDALENKSPDCSETGHLKEDSKCGEENEKGHNSYTDESGSFYESGIGLPKVPSIGTIGHLDSLEFAQLLGNEASRLAEEFMNCSTDSGLPDSDDSVHLKSGNADSNMTDKDRARLSAHLDENVNPFVKSSRLQRSPPLGKRDACGAEGGDASDPIDLFKPRRMLLRESGPGEERLDTSSMDDDSGIALGTRSDLETDVNHSEAGPEIATGLTSSDLQCASQFFKEATDIENQLRKGLSTPIRGSQTKLSGDEVTPTKDKSELPSSTPEPQNKPVPSTSTPVPPHEERSAPEGTSSPTPRPSDTSEHKPSSSRPNSIPSEGYMTAAEVQKLLKQQELQFEEKLLRAELASGEKEKKLRQAMKDEQKEMSSLGESVSELTQSRDALLKLVGQYKGMLASLVGEKEKEKQNQEERIKTLEQERNQALEDLANVEIAFSDVHRKYERTKQVVDTLRRNEETLRGAVSDYEAKLQKQEQKFIEFQKHAEEKIQLANEEFEAMRRANEQEMTKMAALLKKAEMKIMSLQDSNDRKTRENQELTQLCDDLINKVGTSH